MFSLLKSLQLVIPFIVRIYNKISTKGITRYNGEFNRRKSTVFVAMVLVGFGIVYSAYFCLLRYNSVVQQNVLLSNEVSNLKAGVTNYETATRVLEQSKEITRYNLELVDELVKLRRENLQMETQLGVCEMQNSRVDKPLKE